MRKRIATCIEGLDKMLEGGIPEGNQIILAGGPGAGKTLLSIEFLYRNAKQGINGALIALEESKEQLIQNAKDAFPYMADIDQLVEAGKLSIYDIKAVTATVTGGYYVQNNVQDITDPYMNRAMGTRERTLDGFFKGFNNTCLTCSRNPRPEWW